MGYASSRVLGVALVVASAWAYSGVAVLGRTLKEVSFSVLMLINSSFSLVLTVVYLLMEHLYTGNSFRVYSKEQYGILALCTLTNLGKTALFTISFKYSTSGFVSLVSYTSIAWAIAADILIFHESLPVTEFLGGSIILIVTCARSVIKIYEERKQKPQEIELGDLA